MARSPSERDSPSLDTGGQGTLRDLSVSLGVDGFALVPSGLSEPQLEQIGRAIRGAAPAGPRGAGVRRLLETSAQLRRLAGSGPLYDLAVDGLGAATRPTKLTLFDKTAETNWPVPWHQDRTLVVAERREVAGFGPWSIKGGQPCVQAPAEVLSEIVALRLHLDDTPESNGALRVVPGSHRWGLLSNAAIRDRMRSATIHTCEARRGDVLLMRPLLLHSSLRSRNPKRRRVLHFEYSASELPGGLRWPGQSPPLGDSPQ